MPTNLYQRAAMAAAIAACFPGIAYGAGAARVDFAIGNVTAVSPDGRSRPLTKGSEIQVGDTVDTQKGRAQLRFADGAYMSLQPETAFKIEEFHYAGKEDGKENIVMNLLKGGMRTITGLIGRTRKSSYKLRTEVATIGIRGTEYSVRYTNSIEFFCAGGAIEVQNEGSPTPVVFNAGQGGLVKDQQSPPQQTTERPFLAPTSAGGGGQEEQQQADSDPDNPLQDANPPVTEERILAQATQILTGTITGNWAVSLLNQSPIVDIEQPVMLDAAGALTQFTDSVEGPQTANVGTASAQAKGNDGIIAWGRWVNGTTGGDHVAFSNQNLTEQNPLHYVVGMPATGIPTTGTATYNMIGYSASCNGAGCTTAMVNNSSLSANFGLSQISMSMNFTIDGGNAGTYVFSGSPSCLGPGGQFFASGTFAPGCNSFFGQGFLAGTGAVRAGVAWHGFVIGELPTNVNGTTAYTKQ